MLPACVLVALAEAVVVIRARIDHEPGRADAPARAVRTARWTLIMKRPPGELPPGAVQST